MLALYVQADCPYCTKVRIAAAQLGIELEERDVADPAIAEELRTQGGKVQTPYLVDEERGRSLYESDDIIAYLHETFTAES